MFKIIYGNIVDDNILKGKDVFVLPTNPKMRYGMGVSEVVFKKAGIDKLEKYCEDKYNVGYNDDQLKNDMKPTEIRITPGFDLNMDIMFAQSPNSIYFDIPNDELLPLLIETYKNILKNIKLNNYKNVIMPSLGTGHYGFDHEDVAREIVPFLKEFTDKNKLVNITLCLYSEGDSEIYKKYF